jgi:hypothetical protein
VGKELIYSNLKDFYLDKRWENAYLLKGNCKYLQIRKSPLGDLGVEIEEGAFVAASLGLGKYIYIGTIFL